jgi:hypothetical protein
MRSILVLTAACAIALSIAAVRAQDADVVLHFNITKGDALVASPVLRLKSGMVGRIHLDSRDAAAGSVVSGLRERIALTPTIQGENISIAFDITSDEKRFQPSLVISKEVVGGLEWRSSEGQAIGLNVTWVN